MTDPITVVGRFNATVRRALSQHEELRLAVRGKRRQAGLETMLAEQTVMSMAVAWESFCHDILISHLVARPGAYLQALKSSIRQSVNAKFGTAARWVTIAPPSSLSKRQATNLVDPKGWNLTGGRVEDLTAAANRLLGAREARKFSLGAEDGEFLDCLVAIRNYLGHRSEGSKDAIKDAISRLEPSSRNAFLIGTTTGGIGVYLKFRVANSQTRVDGVGLRLQEVSNKLS